MNKQLRNLLWAAIAAAAAGCASAPKEACCAWAGIDARTLLGPDGVDCGTIKSHPLEPRAPSAGLRSRIFSPCALKMATSSTSEYGLLVSRYAIM